MDKTDRHPKEVLKEYGVEVKKSFGQNFLVDEHHLESIASCVASVLTGKGEPVFEIGSGLGALTKALLKKDLRVLAVERDRDMARIMRSEFSDAIEAKRLILNEANATTFDYGNAVDPDSSSFVLCGNLPYHLTSSLIFKALDLAEHISGAVFMIQKEVAQRIVSKSGTRDYSMLSVMVQSICSVQMVHDVPAGAFWPRPKVDSSVIRLIPKKPIEIDAKEFEKLKIIVKAAFSKRRKTLRNALKDVVKVEEVCSTLGIDPSQRPETLTPQQFVAIMRQSISSQAS